MGKTLLLFASVVLLVSGCMQTQPQKVAVPVIDSPQLLPVDESQADPSFAHFKSEFDNAIKAKDADWVIAQLDDNVWSSFGGDGGVEEFIQHYKLHDPESFFWSTVKEAFELGGTFGTIQDERYFTAPYVFSRFPKEYDAFFYSALIEPSAFMREAPSYESPILAELSYTVVKTAFREHHGEKHENGFLLIETIDGLMGWAPENMVRNPLEHRILVKDTSDGWKIASLVAGD